MKKILIVVGTRPELIKLACIVKELQNRNLRNRFLLINTSQHKELLDPYWALFELEPDVTLDVMRKEQSLSNLTARVIEQFQNYINDVQDIGAILAQGDTTTVLGVSLVAFYNRIPFYHLEAGLRSFDFYNPYPEEFNRKVASMVAHYHFCPTLLSKSNLNKEGIPDSKILVIGNTVVDSLLMVKKYVIEHPDYDNEFLTNRLKNVSKIVLITCHRRENQGNNLLDIIESIHELAVENPLIMFVWTLHPNPKVSLIVKNSNLVKVKNIVLIEPLNYKDLVRVLSKSIMVISDSGGIQEEAPSFNVPVLVLRETTERPEGVLAGAAILVGTNKNLIKEKFYYFLTQKINIVNNPYGDGLSSARAVDKMLEIL